MMGQGDQTEEEIKFSEVLSKIAEAHGLESPTTVALAYVLNKAPYVFPIVGGRKVEHLQDNIQALKIKLTPEQIQYLESVKAFDIGFPLNFLGEDPKTTTGRPIQALLKSSTHLDFVMDSRPIGH